MHAKRESGFTLIELVIVAIIVGILATVVATTYSGVQAKNRNAKRQESIKTLQSHLETYYAKNGVYPTYANLSDSNWRTKNLKDLPTEDIRDPQWSKNAKDCEADGQPVPATSPTEKCYSYQVTAADGSLCDNNKTPCAQYTLTAIFEGGDKYVKSSLN